MMKGASAASVLLVSLVVVTAVQWVKVENGSESSCTLQNNLCVFPDSSVAYFTDRTVTLSLSDCTLTLPVFHNQTYYIASDLSTISVTSDATCATDTLKCCYDLPGGTRCCDLANARSNSCSGDDFTIRFRVPCLSDYCMTIQSLTVQAVWGWDFSSELTMSSTWNIQGEGCSPKSLWIKQM